MDVLASPQDKQPFRFLDLPLELRFMVYEYLHTRTHRKIIISPDFSEGATAILVVPGPIPPIFTVCKSVHAEAVLFLRNRRELNRESRIILKVGGEPLVHRDFLFEVIVWLDTLCHGRTHSYGFDQSLATAASRWIPYNLYLEVKWDRSANSSKLSSFYRSAWDAMSPGQKGQKARLKLALDFPEYSNVEMHSFITMLTGGLKHHRRVETTLYEVPESRVRSKMNLAEAEAEDMYGGLVDPETWGEEPMYGGIIDRETWEKDWF
jgi:hypothetical protein